VTSGIFIRRFLTSLVGPSAILLVACGDMGPIAEDRHAVPPELTGMVVDEAEAALATSGVFPSQYISRQPGATLGGKAALLADALVDEYARLFEPMIQDQAGREVDFSLLSRDARVIFAESPYEAAPAGTAQGLRTLVGPYYIFSYSDPRGPAVAVAVSAQTEAFNIVDNRIAWPIERGNEFRFAGIASDRRFGPPMSAEHAAALAVSKTGALVSEVPVFISRGVDFTPFVGTWRVRLDRELSLATPEGLVNSREVFVDFDGSLLVPSRQSPDARRIEIRDPSGGVLGAVLAQPSRVLGQSLVSVHGGGS
jgi:hypothetical protein